MFDGFLWKRAFPPLTAGGALSSVSRMTSVQKHLRVVVTSALLAVCASQAVASGFDSSGSSLFGFTPKVPVSALARPAAWFDPSRMHVSTSVSMGSGFRGGAEGLQVTSLSYQFKAPVWMSVNVGNTWGASSRGNSAMFLEGLDLGLKPFNNFQIQIHYRDMRSPLQYRSFDRPYGWGE